ncbi:HmuY family protein [Marinobacter sp. VGCF2001]|uniref:HmuY family protein n=1 Tax=Marinobacter sp. VGCF2001 TaxID=3417189 RepID=UPI003CF7EF50
MPISRMKVPAVLSAALALTACGGSDNTIEEQTQADADDISGVLLPAADRMVYLNLETGQIVTEEDSWHIAANRMAFKLNSGASGEGKVGGALAVAQDDFYNANGEPDPNVFTNATANSEEEHLRGPFSEPESWQQDAFSSAFGGSDNWSEYNMTNGVIEAKAEVAYLVRSAEGNSYARMKVKDFNFPTRGGQGIESFTFEFYVQPEGASGFSTTPVSFIPPADYSGGDACYDFDAPAVVDCQGDSNWDVKVGFSGREWYLKSNSGVSGPGKGGASDPMTWAEADALQKDPGISQLYLTDSTGGVFSEHLWQAYNLTGEHKIWPNFRTYLIKADVEDSGSTVWALQIIGYYTEAGESGNPTVRWLPVTTR